MYNNVVEWDVDNDNWTCPENLLPVLEENHQLSQYALVSSDNTVTQTTLASADIFDTFKTTLSDNWIKLGEDDLICRGFKYNKEKNVFIPPKPFESWILNEETFQWNPPIPYPTGSEQRHVWDEESKNWKELNN